MTWRIKQKIVNKEMVFIYSSRKVVIESVVELNEKQLAKIHSIIKEEKDNTGKIASRIVCELGKPIKGAGCGFVGFVVKKTYVDINTRHAMSMI